MKFFFILTTVLLCFDAIAQQSESYLLESFKYRIDKYRALNFSVGGSGSHVRDSEDINYSKSSNANGGIGIDGIKLKSTEKILQSLNLNFQSNISSSGSKIEASKGKSNSYFGFLNGSINNKIYSGKSFFLTEGSAYIMIASGKNRLANNFDWNRNSQSATNFHAGVGLGNGRLENIRDMQNALWLVRSLKEEKILNSQLSNDELADLGKAITQANNTRVLDSRRKTRFILTAVDNFLQKKGLIPKADIQYFTAMNDILFFAINDVRMSGIEKSVKIVPTLYYGRSYNKQPEPVNKNEEKTKVLALSFIASWKKHKPISLFHQRNYGVETQLVRAKRDFSLYSSVNGNVYETMTEEYDSKASLSAFLHHYYYPNSRTAIYLLLNTEGGYNVFSGNSRWFNKTSIECQLNYFISYNTRLTGGIATTFQKNYYDIININQFNERWRLNANIGLDISL